MIDAHTKSFRASLNQKAYAHTWKMSHAYLERLMVVVCSDLTREAERQKHAAELDFI